MSDVWFISDTHFGHENILTFRNYDGTPLRVFDTVTAMDEHMVKQWNSVVKPQDKVYHLGDIALSGKHLPILSRLNGHKRLVRGNHDANALPAYTKHFEEIYGVRVFSKEGFICSHIPIHPDCLSRWKVNVHGHLHGNRIMHHTQIDPRYFSVCVEKIEYTPIHIDTILQYIKNMELKT